MPSQRMLGIFLRLAQPAQAYLLLPAESVYSSSSLQQHHAQEGSSMRQGKFWFAMSGMLAVLVMALMLPADAVAASKYKLLHRFAKGRADGRYPTPDSLRRGGESLRH